MTLLKDAWNFMATEKRWTLLFILTLLIYGSVSYWHASRIHEPVSPALERLRSAELKLKEQIRSTGSIQKFIIDKVDDKDKTHLFIIFNIFTLILISAVIAGLLIDIVWLIYPDWRMKFRVKSPPEAHVWNISTIFKIIVIFLLANFGISIFLSLFKWVFPAMNPNSLILIHTTIADILCVGFVVYFVQKLGGKWKDLGFHGVDFWRDFKAGLTGYLAVLPLFFLVLIGVVVVANYFGHEPPAHPLVEIFLEEEKTAPHLVAYSIFLACVIGPILEEIFFRGFCYPAFKKRWGMGWGITLSAAFFALIHQNYFAFFPIFILGACLSYLYEKRGTLVPSVVLHIVHNAIFVVYFFIAKETLTAI